MGRRVNTLLYTQVAVADRVQENVRFDGLNHYINRTDIKSRCALCSKAVQTFCRKCQVKLHVECFAPFHGHCGYIEACLDFYFFDIALS